MAVFSAATFDPGEPLPLHHFGDGRLGGGGGAQRWTRTHAIRAALGGTASNNTAGNVALISSVSSRPGQQLLDKDSLTCLLILFFVDDQHLNLGRLHKILRSLCCHVATRDWILRSLLSILEKSQYDASALEDDTKVSFYSSLIFNLTAVKEF